MVRDETGGSPASTRRRFLGRCGLGVAAVVLADGLFPESARGAPPEGKPEPKSDIETAGETQYAEALERIRYHRGSAFRRLIAKGQLTKEHAEISPDDAKNEACTRHAAYLAHDESLFKNPLTEDPARPGYSEEGLAVARRAFVVPAKTPRLAVDLMAMGINWRMTLLDPNYRTLYYGFAWKKNASRGASVISLPEEYGDARYDEPVLYPSPDQLEVPLEYHSAMADVVPPGSGKNTGGYPVSAAFHPSLKCVNAKASLADSRRKAVDCWVITPGKPAVEKGYHVPNGVFLVPKVPLRKLEKYTVKMSAEIWSVLPDELVRKWEEEWSFTAAIRATDLSEIQFEYYR